MIEDEAAGVLEGHYYEAENGIEAVDKFLPASLTTFKFAPHCNV